MLRKRTRSVQKDQNQISDSGSESSFHSDVGNKNPKNNSFYTTIPGLLVGLSPKGLALADCDSVRSPTSPLDFRLFSGLGNPFRSSSSSSSSSSSTTNARSSCKLGLISIIDSLDNDYDNNDNDDDCCHGMKFSGRVLRSPRVVVVVNNKPFLNEKTTNKTNPFVGSSPKSLPKNYPIFPYSSKPKSPLRKGSSDVLFEIGDDGEDDDSFGKIRSCSLDSCRTISNLSGLRAKLNNNTDTNTNSSSIDFSLEDCINSNSVTGQVTSPKFIGPLSASEIELSEDYTCVISHGPNPKTTHIFGDCILETHSKNDLSNNFGKSWDNTKEVRFPNPKTNSDGFLSFCHSCNNKLEDGKDIYIYRGEKAFCSLNCRSLEILIDEELEKSSDKDSEISLCPDDEENDDDDQGKELFLIATST